MKKWYFDFDEEDRPALFIVDRKDSNIDPINKTVKFYKEFARRRAVKELESLREHCSNAFLPGDSHYHLIVPEIDDRIAKYEKEAHDGTK